MLSEKLLEMDRLDFRLDIPTADLKLVTDCWTENLDRDPEFLIGCFRTENFGRRLRVKRDEDIMQKIVAAYSDVFGSQSKTQKK